VDYLLQGNWRQLCILAQKRWAKLSEDDIDQIQGRWDLLVEKLQERYGYTKLQAEQQIMDWLQEARLGTDSHR